MLRLYMTLFFWTIKKNEYVIFRAFLISLNHYKFPGTDLQITTGFLIADALALCFAMVSAYFGLIPAITQAPSALMFLMMRDFRNSGGWIGMFSFKAGALFKATDTNT